MLRLKIKVFYDFDESEYVCLINGVSDLEGRGFTEKEAIDNFKLNYEEMMRNDK